MPKVPSMSSKALIKMLEKGRAFFVRQGKTDHAIYARIVKAKRYSAPVQRVRRHWIQSIARGSYDSCNLLMKKLRDYYSRKSQQNHNVWGESYSFNHSLYK